MRLVYLVGQPGAGKSTALNLATIDWSRTPAAYVKGVPAHQYRHDASDHLAAIELGAHREPFGGTDTLALNAQPKVLDLLAQRPHALVIGEGDRLANVKFFTAVRQLGIDLSVVYWRCPDELAAERRRSRAVTHGLELQSPAWVQGRITKLANVVRSVEGVITVTCTDVDAIAQLREILGTTEQA